MEFSLVYYDQVLKLLSAGHRCTSVIFAHSLSILRPRVCTSVSVTPYISVSGYNACSSVYVLTPKWWALVPVHCLAMHTC
jgi:hypothetical protein